MTDSQLFSSWLICALFINLTSCGDADHDPAGDARGGSSGSASSGAGGTATGGATDGGAANSGGSDAGGAGGSSGSDAGGAGGSSGSDAGGAGGTGAELTLAEVCDKTCTDEAALDCAFPFDECVTTCMSFGTSGDLQAPDEYLSMLRCQAELLGPADYVCLPMDPDPVIWPAPVAETSCEPAICAWYCAEEFVWGNSAVYYRCGCD